MGCTLPQGRWLPEAGGLAAIAFVAGLCVGGPAAATDPVAARLVRVDDADAYRVEVDGREESVRVLGVRVLPFVDRSGASPCGGPAAILAAREVLGRGLLRLEADRTAPERDADGALLRYVHAAADGRDLGATLLEAGLATVERGLEFDRRAAYERLEETARRHRDGLWPVCPSRLADAGRPAIVRPLPAAPGADRSPRTATSGPPPPAAPSLRPSRTLNPLVQDFPPAQLAEPSRTCCRICRKGKACGDSCIRRAYTCRKPPGCACDA
ncbi:MAG: thermonuclease family protein [Acidobacteriota bacterium]